MFIIKTSELNNLKTDVIKFIKENTQELERKKVPWGIEIDTDTMNFPYWNLFFDEKGNEFEYLETINVTNSEDYYSKDGILFNKKRELIYAPISKRLNLPIDDFESFKPAYGSDWNIYSSPILRSVLKAYVDNKIEKSYLEKVLTKFIPCMIYSAFLALEKKNIFHFSPDSNIKVVISNEKPNRHYEGINNFKKEDKKPFIHSSDFLPKYYDSFDENILGTYDEKNNTIILYIKNIMEKEKGRNFEDFFISVFAHQIFHFLHYFNVVEKDKWKTFEFLNETLSATNQYFVLKKILNNESLADKYLRSLKEHYFFIYPESGAVELINASVLKIEDGLPNVRDAILARELVEYSLLDERIERECELIAHFEYQNGVDFITLLFISVKNLAFAETYLLKIIFSNK